MSEPQNEGGGTQSQSRAGVGVGSQEVGAGQQGWGWVGRRGPTSSFRARQTIFALGSNVTQDNRLSQLSRAPKSRTSAFTGHRTKGGNGVRLSEALRPLGRMERGLWGPLKGLTLHPSNSM